MNRRELREHIFRLLFCMEFHEPEELTEQTAMYMEALAEPKQKEIDYMTHKTEKIYALREKLDEKICIGQGFRGKTGNLGVGACTCRFVNNVKGCPPTENQIYDFLKDYILNYK